MYECRRELPLALMNELLLTHTTDPCKLHFIHTTTTTCADWGVLMDEGTLKRKIEIGRVHSKNQISGLVNTDFQVYTDVWVSDNHGVAF